MAWFKVDDQFGSHPKVMQIPRSERASCIGAWLMAGVWSAQHLTDGVVPDYMLEELGIEVSQRDRLVTVELWMRDSDGIAFKDWSDHQPTREQVMANRERERLRKEAYRNQGKKNGLNSGQSPKSVPVGQTEGHQAESGHPDPTRPDPTRPLSKDSKRGTRVPDSFTIDGSMREWAKENVPLVNIDSKLPEFIDYWKSVAGAKGVKRDWVSTWRNGMRKQQEFAVKDQPKQQPARRRINDYPDA